jgi:dTDP-4-amino-4,6-dideoxygalactose transaminase
VTVENLPQTETVTARVVALPTGLAVDPEDARKIASFIAGIA